MLGHLVLTHHDDEARGSAPHYFRWMWRLMATLARRL